MYRIYETKSIDRTSLWEKFILKFVRGKWEIDSENNNEVFVKFFNNTIYVLKER